jgi:hypothetical protein
MLGCQDFCGYYDWTFSYLRRKFGTPAVEKLWREAIAKDAQLHYIASAEQSALRGLYDSWNHSGESEQCDWTVSLDEARNHLRLDMRQCPSKGYLLQNDRNADEDYCDHCIGWIGPTLDIVNAEVVAHEHNHCGQCWWQIRSKSQPSTVPELPADIRQDPRWQAGYIDRFEHHRRAGIVGPVESLFASGSQILVIGDGFATPINLSSGERPKTSIATDSAFLKLDPGGPVPRCVLLGCAAATLQQVAELWKDGSRREQPILLHSYLPTVNPVPFVEFGLPRPVPILPVLIRKGIYNHRPGMPHPSTNAFALMLALAFSDDILAIGIQREVYDELGRFRGCDDTVEDPQNSALQSSSIRWLSNPVDSQSTWQCDQ